MPLVNFSGIASGIDTDGLIQATLDARRQTRVEPYEEEVENREQENESLKELKSQFTSLKESLDDFTSLSSDGLVKSAISTDETVAAATASGSASTGSFDITVNQVAKNAFFSFEDRYPTSTDAAAPGINDAAPAVDRTLEFKTGTGSEEESISVVLTSTTTISDIVSEFNSASNKAQASIVNVGTDASPSYAITISTLETGLEKGSFSLTAGSEFTSAGQLAATTISQAENAEFSVSGISGIITRGNNTVTNVIPGVTIELEGLGTTSISVEIDVDASTDKVESLVESINEIIQFVDTENEVTREEDGENVDNIFSSLARTRIDENAVQSLKDAIRGSRGNTDSVARIFSDIGITSSRTGEFEFDADEFKAKLNQDSGSVETLLTDLADTAAITGGTIDQFTRFNGLLDTITNNNDTRINNLNTRIAEAEASLASTEESMRARFARFEGLMGRLQSQQSQLAGALGGLVSG